MVQDKGHLVHSHPANELTEKLFGFESVIAKETYATATAVNKTVESDAVPTGKVWKITHVCAWNKEGDIATRLTFVVYHNGEYVDFHSIAGVIAEDITVDKHVELYLDAGDRIRAYFYGVANGEDCYLNIFGYEMNVP